MPRCDQAGHSAEGCERSTVCLHGARLVMGFTRAVRVAEFVEAVWQSMPRR